MTESITTLLAILRDWEFDHVQNNKVSAYFTRGYWFDDPE